MLPTAVDTMHLVCNELLDKVTMPVVPFGSVLPASKTPVISSNGPMRWQHLDEEGGGEGKAGAEGGVVDAVGEDPPLDRPVPLGMRRHLWIERAVCVPVCTICSSSSSSR